MTHALWLPNEVLKQSASWSLLTTSNLALFIYLICILAGHDCKGKMGRASFVHTPPNSPIHCRYTALLVDQPCLSKSPLVLSHHCQQGRHATIPRLFLLPSELCARLGLGRLESQVMSPSILLAFKILLCRLPQLHVGIHHCHQMILWCSISRIYVVAGTHHRFVYFFYFWLLFQGTRKKTIQLLLPTHSFHMCVRGIMREFHLFSNPIVGSTISNILRHPITSLSWASSAAPCLLLNRRSSVRLSLTKNLWQPRS